MVKRKNTRIGTTRIVTDTAELVSLIITGFMYGCAVSILSQCWEYGEYLRKWHNKKYDYDGDGAVNPAVITVG